LIERMTDRSREVLAAAQRAAVDCGHASLEAPHIVLGILADPRTKGAQALRHGGLTYDGVLDVVAAMYERWPEGAGVAQAVSHEFGALLRGAQREARALEHGDVRTAHLALACARDDGVTSIGPIVAGRERMIRGAALGLLARAARVDAASASRQARPPKQELLLDPPDFLGAAKVLRGGQLLVQRAV
jgi:ATP-dependent Clp protease ATP-binding subunit ClpA